LEIVFQLRPYLNMCIILSGSVPSIT
jgi:hypothetical protein